MWQYKKDNFPINYDMDIIKFFEKKIGKLNEIGIEIAREIKRLTPYINVEIYLWRNYSGGGSWNTEWVIIE